MKCAHSGKIKTMSPSKEKNDKQQGSGLFDVSEVSVVKESLENLGQYWSDSRNRLRWDCLFVLPPWIKAWWKVFGKGYELYICSVRHRDRLTGIAPLMIRDNAAYLIGNEDTCDYGDFIFRPGNETGFLSVLFSHLKKQGITHIYLRNIQGSSLIRSTLAMHENLLKARSECQASDRIYGMELPGTWKEYLSLLSLKDRHEIRRKMRRLHEAGTVKIQVVSRKVDIDSYIDLFIKLFRSNIPEKEKFMTRDMELFFRNLARETVDEGMLKMLVLLIDEYPAAATVCFDYRGDMYLYNNGYDRRYRHLSVGLISKVLSIREGIKLRRKQFNFLKGDEPYKRRLGGTHSQLYNCSIILKK